MFFGTGVLIILKVVVVIHVSEFSFTIFASKALRFPVTDQVIVIQNIETL